MEWTADNDPTITAENNKPSNSKLVPRSAGMVPLPRDSAVGPIQNEESPPVEFPRGFKSRPSVVREFRIDLSVTKWPHLSKSLATITRLHTSELMAGEIELEKSLSKVVILLGSVDKAAEFRTSEGLDDKTYVWQVFSVVLKDYARAVAIYIQEHAKGKYVRMVPAELRNLHELYVRNYTILFEHDMYDGPRELTYTKTECTLAMLVEATRERSIKYRGKMPSEILANLVSSIDAERILVRTAIENKQQQRFIGFIGEIPDQSNS